MIPRLYAPMSLLETGEAALSPEQAHYLRNVLRRGVGDPVLLFNERDGEFRATIAALDKRRARLALGAQTRAPVARPDIELWCALVKRPALDAIARKTSELGAARMRLALTERAQARAANVERLRAIAVEAAEQCEAFGPPEIAEPATLGALLSAAPPERRLIYCDEAGEDAGARWGGDQGRAPAIGDALRALEPELQRGPARAFAILIGPEGGFSRDERAALRARENVIAVSLGPRILRADTAAAAALSVWQSALGDWRA